MFSKVLVFSFFVFFYFPRPYILGRMHYISTLLFFPRMSRLTACFQLFNVIGDAEVGAERRQRWLAISEGGANFLRKYGRGLWAAKLRWLRHPMRKRSSKPLSRRDSRRENTRGEQERRHGKQKKERTYDRFAEILCLCFQARTRRVISLSLLPGTGVPFPSRTPSSGTTFVSVVDLSGNSLDYLYHRTYTQTPSSFLLFFGGLRLQSRQKEELGKVIGRAHSSPATASRRWHLRSSAKRRAPTGPATWPCRFSTTSKNAKPIPRALFPVYPNPDFCIFVR